MLCKVPKDKSEIQKKLWVKLRSWRKSVAFNQSPIMRKKNRYAAWVAFGGMKLSYIIGRKFGQKGSMN